ncbi:MAG: hypothetical protein K2L14_09660 [Duncaniella sp.]|nr:hypothetical protein [Duncaniella sp.]
MADNYLEKKMEEHRSRMAAGVASRPRRQQSQQGSALSFPMRRVLVAAEGLGWQAQVVAALRAAGHKVAIIDPAGATLAQATGARCYPFTSGRIDEVIADLDKHWGGLDITVMAARDGDEISVDNATDGIRASVTVTEAAATASAVVLLTHPSARLIHGSESHDRE